MNNVRFSGYMLAVFVFILSFASCNIDGTLDDLRKEAAHNNSTKDNSTKDNPTKDNPSYTVTFSINDGTDTIASKETVPSGDKATRPENPGRSSYIFDYWYTDIGFTTPYNFNTAVKSNITLYAKWVSQTDINAMAGKNMVFVPGGSFVLGKELNPGVGGNDVTPVTNVTVSGFYMDKYEVTQSQYQAVMETNPSSFTTSPEGNLSQLPVETVSWYNAIVFCNRLSTAEHLTLAYEMQTAANTNVWSSDYTTWGTVPNNTDARWDAVRIVAGSTGYRLPTEAQWEYAAKGGDGSPGSYTYSGSNIVGDVAWYNGNSVSSTHEVGEKPPNGLGIYDMSGNVWEWCWDWYGTYPGGIQTDPMGASAGPGRVNRGGCWFIDAGYARSVYRNNSYPNSRRNDIGFRVSLP